ncbi:MAG: sn-glycerol-3-phosphate ABC transporter ATP-binding protein UgpC [Bosea sp.]|uniref:ABC transporter ATP-binding protein n=1 Tax=Bosea sp. (in: a-proteobacteria) TaxID=1871050 RepID=UPI002395C79F|nr:sn-glycerol-3-phosphate ABC transporter ATP-binding protein UgpC [Bosea sp. (in: a-proteobacteria)]MCP4736501.1 sn-glycerol-3-phosphate ABC transporter ATP-binding protein UgpC [Bosea sp. (in: a-proteobacteria)]
MTTLSLTQVQKRFGAVEVIRGVDLSITSGEFVVFVGPSGCGKSTLLRMIAGLEPISGGELSIGGIRMNDTAASQRGIAMVFQSYALYPHMSVFKNMSFGLETARMAKAEIDRRVRKAAEILQITPLLERKPRQLSGGQRQRVAIGRAIVRDPKIFLFDEPLSNLDAELRVQTRVEIAKLHADIGATMIYVTHDQVEAMTLADRIVVLRAGIVEQHGTPLDIYNKPANRFIAGFIGSPKMNFIDVTAAEDGGNTTIALGAGRFSLPTRDRIDAGEKLTLGVRPEHVITGGAAEIDLGTLAIIHVEQLGGQTIAYGRLADGQPLNVVLEGQRRINAGDSLPVGAMAEGCHLFADDGLRLNS